MANVVDTKLYDILGVSPSVSENELKKVTTQRGRGENCLWRLTGTATVGKYRAVRHELMLAGSEARLAG